MSLTDEFDPHQLYPHQYTTAVEPADAQGVRRRRRTIPTIQLSRATIWAAVFAIAAGITSGVAITRLAQWDDAQMTTVEGQHALAGFTTTLALAVLLALGAMVIWGVSTIVSRQATHAAEILGGQAAITLRFLGVVDDVRRDIRVARQPKVSQTSRRRRRRDRSPVASVSVDDILTADNVIHLPTPETIQAVSRLARKFAAGDAHPNGHPDR